ncbi:response regulator, partial [Kurthia sp. Dielmo]|uniref:response regulator n=1 Tax=Kurthia sp. Dielmo TaxID=1033738 RepID=UPI0011CC853F
MTLKLLIVDDEPIERQALQQILQKAFPDFQMMQAKNGREAVEYALKEEPDLVLMDILMPGMTGLEAIKLIQQKGIECQFVMVTAFDTFDYAKSALQLGVKDYLLKPTTPKEMTQIIGAIAEKIIAEKQQKQQFEPFIEQAFVSQLLFDAMDSVEDVLPLPLKETTSFAVLMVTFAEQVKGEAVLKKAQQYGVYSGVLYEQRRPFIIPIKEDFRQETMRVAKAFIAALEEQHYSSVAISSQIPSLDELSRGYREAWLVSGVAQRVIYFEDYVQFVPMEADWQAAIDQLDWHKIRLLFQQMTQQKPLAEAREEAFQKLWQVHTQLHQLGLEMGPPTLSFSDESQA